MSEFSQHSKTLFLLKDVNDFADQALLLASSARRNIMILSRTLDAPVYDSENFVTALSTLARSSRYSHIQLLIKNTEPLIERGHKLARLAQRLSSKIILRKMTLEPENGEMGFMLCDQTGLLYKNDERDYRGFADTDAAAEVRRLREIFNYLWQYAEPEPRLQILNI